LVIGSYESRNFEEGGAMKARHIRSAAAAGMIAALLASAWVHSAASAAQPPDLPRKGTPASRQDERYPGHQLPFDASVAGRITDWFERHR
jgi:hypothetical protein